ncbi:MAG: methionine--tRNA ligase, partial [Spirochaetaceae bacterium]
GIGVFGSDAVESGIPADVWRFYIYYNRPEKNDTTFTWTDFKEKVNGELLGNFSNLVNRSLTFIDKFYEGKVPAGKPDPEFQEIVRKYCTEIRELLDAVELRSAFYKIFELSSIGNKRFQDGQPWKMRTEAPEQAASLLHELTYLIRDLAIMLAPYLPATSEKVLGFLGIEKADWSALGTQTGILSMKKPELLFQKLEDDQIEVLRQKFSGSQKERKAAVADEFRAKVDLRVAKITGITRHPGADKLYVEQIDLGTETRQIVSGLVPYYREEELLGKNVIVVANLKAAKLRGEESRGMLLAADDGNTVEVIFAPDASPGDRVVFVDEVASDYPVATEIEIGSFFEIPLIVKDKSVTCEGKVVAAAGKPLATDRVISGKVG